jgi:hypothetical protein
MISRILLISFLLAALATARAQTVCPWFTAGSAESVLGGEVRVTANSEGNWQGSCRFTRQAQSALQSIEIEIGKANPHACPEGSTKIKALGNESVQCRRASSHGDASYVVTGRVRDAYFVVTMTGVPDANEDPAADPRISDAYGASKIERVAEQVAGNLF